MKYLRIPFLLFITLLFLVSCSSNHNGDNPDPNPPTTPDNPLLEVNDFVFNGMNIFYLYRDQDNVFDDNHFKNDEEYTNYLNGFDKPEDLFDELVVDQDRFSVIFPNYVELENALNGIIETDGMEYGLSLFSNSSDGIFAFVRYVLPDTPAEQEGIQRGMLFHKVDGQDLTLDNYQDLLVNAHSYTITLDSLSDNTIYETDQDITLTKITDYDEDPVYIHKTLDIDGHKIGYLMYNGFYGDYDDELNNAFGDFKADGVTDLVVDLRYNGGGSIESSKDLGSMITGQFKGQLFAKEQFNEIFGEDEINFDDEIHTGEKINSLNLNHIYFLATGSTASASELVINALKPYIDVTQIGVNTVGKYQGSITVYDSEQTPNADLQDMINNYLDRSKMKEGHTYAMQPLILKLVNADGVTDYNDGLTPDIQVQEDIANMGVLGDPDEPMLNAAIRSITGNTQTPAAFLKTSQPLNPKVVGESKMGLPTFQRMYLNPEQFQKRHSN